MDYSIFQTINSLVGKFICLDKLGIFLADRFSYVLIGILFLFLFKNCKKYWRMVIGALTAAVLSRFVIIEIIRLFWSRSRPFVESQVNLLLSHEADASFPSGHAAFFFAISTVVCLYNKKAGIVFFIASFLIGIARVFVGVHWPSDILAGAAVGILSGCLVAKILQKLQK